MTKIICVNQNKLGKIIGYGFWIFITIGLLSILALTLIEKDNFTVQIDIVKECYSDRENKDETVCYEREYKIYCYDDLFENSNMCTSERGQRGIQSSFLFDLYLRSIGVIFNFIVMGFWTYDKQQKFKFSWCNKIKHDGQSGSFIE